MQNTLPRSTKIFHTSQTLFLEFVCKHFVTPSGALAERVLSIMRPIYSETMLLRDLVDFVGGRVGGWQWNDFPDVSRPHLVMESISNVHRTHCSSITISIRILRHQAVASERSEAVLCSPACSAPATKVSLFGSLTHLVAPWQFSLTNMNSM